MDPSYKNSVNPGDTGGGGIVGGNGAAGNDAVTTGSIATGGVITGGTNPEVNANTGNNSQVPVNQEATQQEADLGMMDNNMASANNAESDGSSTEDINWELRSTEDQGPKHVSDEEFFENFKNSVTSTDSADGDIILDGGKKKNKKKLIIGAVAAAVCVVIGIIVFIFVGLPAMEPVTGDDIKPKNYEEAFNIYANYFLFGEKSKLAVDWELTKDEEFVDYFDKVIESPDLIESIVSGQETREEILERADQYYTNFQQMYLGQDEKEEYLTSYVESYSKYLKFLVKYYNVGLPTIATLSEDYLEAGYEGAEQKAWEIASNYEDVGTLYDTNIMELVGRLGDSQVSLIEEYRLAGCIIDDEMSPSCAEESGDEGINEYWQKSEEYLVELSSINYNASIEVSEELYRIDMRIGYLNSEGEGEE